MKLLGCTLLVLLFWSCKNRRNEEINLVFQPQSVFKSISSRSFCAGSGFCGGCVWLNSDSTFTDEGGCEGRSGTTVGKWRVIGDSVELTAFKKSPENLSFNVYLSKSNKNPQTVFIIKDKTDKPIENFVIQPFNHKIEYLYFENGFITDQIMDDEKTVHDFLKRPVTNSLGIIKIQKGISDSLDLSKLYALTGKRYAISAGNLPDTVKIMINLNKCSFVHSKIKYVEMPKKRRFHYVNKVLLYGSK